jgi:hypothetical protein
MLPLLQLLLMWVTLPPRALLQLHSLQTGLPLLLLLLLVLQMLLARQKRQCPQQQQCGRPCAAQVGPQYLWSRCRGE